MEQMIDGRTVKGSLDKVKVISMLYSGAVNFTRAARMKIQQGDFAGKSLYIRKTSAIVKELSSSLNMDGGKLALNLRHLYGFVIESLCRADAQNDLNAIDDAEKVIVILRDAWEEIQQVKMY